MHSDLIIISLHGGECKEVRYRIHNTKYRLFCSSIKLMFLNVVCKWIDV